MRASLILVLGLLAPSITNLWAHEIQGPQYAVRAQSTLVWSQFCQESRFENYVRVANAMRDYVKPEVWMDFYLPMRTLATKVSISLKVNGALSGMTRDLILEFADFMNENRFLIDELFEVEVFYDVASDLSLFTESLIRDLR